MHIVLLAPSVTAHDGWSVYARALRVLFEKQGMRVTVLTADANTDGPRLPGVFARVQVWVWSAARLWMWIRHTKPDAVWIAAEPYAKLFPAWRGLPFAITVHGTYAEPRAHIPWWASWMYVRALHRAQQIVAISHFTAARVPLFARARVHVIPNGADPAFADGVSTAIALYGRPLVLSVGAIKPRKGFVELVYGFALFHMQHPDAELVIVGSATDSVYLETVKQEIERAGLSGAVRLVGHVSDTELLGWYRACDVFALTPVEVGGFEGFGLVYLQAGSCGKPCVGSSGSGAAEAIVDGVTGYAVNPRDPQAIADALERARGLSSDRIREAVEQQTWESRGQAYSDVVSVFVRRVGCPLS